MRFPLLLCTLAAASAASETYTATRSSTAPANNDTDTDSETWIDAYPSRSPQSWSLPSDSNNMGPFNISTFAAGAANMAILRGSPTADVWSTAVDQVAFHTEWDDSVNSLQILYPKGSNAPRNQPQGGAEFYAMPLDLVHANNASLEYSVYFPREFDWVKGGKLPGLYGGHRGCSGGDAAVDCFSTRLMWRADGDGELYLYVPKDKQTSELCALPPKSICDSNYGLSIGRGSWRFVKGGWTTIRQDIWLNTPGRNDGGFNIWINGLRVLTYNQVRYREIIQDCQVARQQSVSPAADQPSGVDHPWGPIDSPLVPNPQSSAVTTSAFPSLQPATSIVVPSSQDNVRRAADYPWDAAVRQASSTSIIDASIATQPSDIHPFKIAHGAPPSDTGCDVGFIGLFFSTFYGGHTADWSPSQDQYSYFKNFHMRIHG